MVYNTRMSKSPVGPVIDVIQRRRVNETGPSPSHTQPEDGPGQCQPKPTEAGSSCASRTRGPSLGLETWKRTGEPINIESNEWDQPIGDNSIEFETHLGVLARNNQLAPLTFTNWRAVPLNLKQLMWSEIERKFNIGIHLKKHVFKSIGKKWKDYKSRLKASYYDPKLSLIERLANLPPRVHEDQWLVINQFWDSEKGKKRIRIAKANRSHLQMNHTTGRKSYAQIRASEKRKRGGLNPSRAEMFRLTHLKKNQQPVDSKSAGVMVQLSAIEHDKPDSSLVVASRSDSLSQVLGEDRHGYVRMFGLGPSPSDVFGPQPTRTDYKRMADYAIKSSDERVHAMEEQMSGMQKTIEEMATQIQSMKVAMKNTSSVRLDTTQHLDCLDSFPPTFSQDKSVLIARGMCSQVESHSNQPSSSSQLKHSSDKSIVLKRKKRVEVKKTKAMRVDLLSFENPEEIVAQGRVVSKDANKDVGGFKLGPYFWEIYVEIAIK